MADVWGAGAAVAICETLGVPLGWQGCTITHMTQEGGDLVLNEGAPYGTCETTAGIDCARIASQFITCPFEVEANPAGTGGNAKAKIEIATSDDDISYSSWAEFRDGIYYCRYYKMKGTVYGDAGVSVRPKITRFDPEAAPANTEPVWPGLEDEVNTLPLNPRTGSNYLVGSAPTDVLTGHAGQRVYVADSTPPSYGLVFFHPVKGQLCYLKDVDEYKIHNGTEWEYFDPRRQFRNSIHRHGQGYNSLNGNYQYTIDAAQDSNGYMETATGGSAVGDYLEFKAGMHAGVYTIVVLVVKNVLTCGTLQLLVDGVPVTTWDCGAVPLTKNARLTFAAVTLGSGKDYTFQLKTSAVGGGGGTDMYISWVEIFPT